MAFFVVNVSKKLNFAVDFYFKTKCHYEKSFYYRNYDNVVILAI